MPNTKWQIINEEEADGEFDLTLQHRDTKEIQQIHLVQAQLDDMFKWSDALWDHTFDARARLDGN